MAGKRSVRIWLWSPVECIITCRHTRAATRSAYSYNVISNLWHANYVQLRWTVCFIVAPVLYFNAARCGCSFISLNSRQSLDNLRVFRTFVDALIISTNNRVSFMYQLIIYMPFLCHGNSFQFVSVSEWFC